VLTYDVEELAVGKTLVEVLGAALLDHARARHVPEGDDEHVGKEDDKVHL
jgi:hypothetical protein